MIDQKNSVFIALIHNNNVRRNNYIRPQLDELARALYPLLIEKIEISFQSELKPHGTCMAFLRDMMYRKLDREWHRYRLLKPLTLLRDILGFAKYQFIKYVLERDRIGKAWRMTSAVEVLVTDKHVRAWGAFLDSGADFLLCFEDDAIFKGDSIQKINELFDTVCPKYLGMPIYVDLAGGCEVGKLKISNLEIYQDKYIKSYSKPVTNTACAYLMNRQLATSFYENLMRRPWLRLIGADWLMNSLFMRLDADGTKCICMHTTPTIFDHGTTTGAYLSSIR